MSLQTTGTINLHQLPAIASLLYAASDVRKQVLLY